METNKFVKLIQEALDSGKKITRDAFLYMKPRSNDHAQCSSCIFFKKDDKLCLLHGPDVKMDGGFSCGLYVPGKPVNFPVKKYVTPQESGLVDRQVRCENCKFGGEECGLYKMLNKKMPEVFDLDTKIESKACCNAQTPSKG